MPYHQYFERPSFCLSQMPFPCGIIIARQLAQIEGLEAGLKKAVAAVASEEKKDDGA